MCRALEKNEQRYHSHCQPSTNLDKQHQPHWQLWKKRRKTRATSLMLVMFQIAGALPPFARAMVEYYAKRHFERSIRHWTWSFPPIWTVCLHNPGRVPWVARWRAINIVSWTYTFEACWIGFDTQHLPPSPAAPLYEDVPLVNRAKMPYKDCAPLQK